MQDLDGPRFLTVQSLYSRNAPEGGALIYTFRQLDPARPTDPREDERDLEDLLDTAQPGWRDVLVKRQYLPRIEAVSTLPTASGGGFAGRVHGCRALPTSTWRATGSAPRASSSTPAWPAPVR